MCSVKVAVTCRGECRTMPRAAYVSSPIGRRRMSAADSRLSHNIAMI
jgi:hypothetical protein